MDCSLLLCGLFFFNDTATTESYTYLHTLPLHDALPISSEVTRLFDPFPQLLRNVRFNGGAPLDDAAVQAAIRDGESRLGSGGRLVIRKSGTERVIRSEEHTSELQSLMRISYAVFCLKKKTTHKPHPPIPTRPEKN